MVNLCFQNSSTYWEGKADMETLQRIYGISFPDPKMLKEWEKFQEEAKNRDHRKIGRVCLKNNNVSRLNFMFICILVVLSTRISF